MKKLVLDLDTLEIASFETAAPEMEARGTVEAQSLSTIGEKLRDYLTQFICG